MEISYTLMENGLDFILSSAVHLGQLNEIESGVNPKRQLKYSLLHLFSGIELILKYCLVQEHWTYVYADMNRADKHAFSNGDFQSASSDELLKRLNCLCDIQIRQHHEKELRKLKELRNKAMHFELTGNINVIEGHINKNVSFIIEFITEHITLGNLSDRERELLNEIKQALKELSRHYHNAVLLANKAAVEKGVAGCLTECIECEEKYLWQYEGGGECLFCGEKYDGERLARLYLSEQGIDEYTVVKEGGEYPCYECPECGSNSFVISHEYDFARCFACEVQYSENEVGFCSWCNQPYIGENDDGDGMCTSCCESRFGKG